MSKLIQGVNDLETVNPQLAKEWHPTKNGDLKPTDITVGSSKKVWWFLHYYDVETKKYFNFEWRATVNARNRGNQCPFLLNRMVYNGFNDLETYCIKHNFKYLLDEIDFSKNLDLQPSNIVYGSSKEIWWKCPKGHSYNLKISYRTLEHQNCPFCSKEARTSFPEQVIYYYVKQIFQDAINGYISEKIEFDIYIPSLKIAIEYDGHNFHQNLNHDIRKNNYCINNNIILYRFRELGCPNMQEHHFLKIINCIPKNINDLKNAINILGNYLNVHFHIDIEADRLNIYNQYILGIKKNNLAEKYPNLASEWHPTKNGNLTPDMVSCFSEKIVFWFLPYDDPKTGKHFDFEWKSSIKDRVKNNGCPFLAKANAKVWVGFNDLATVNPKMAMEWHPTKNGDLKPTDVTSNSGRKVWWSILYYDSNTKKYFDFEWKSSVDNRIKGKGCPYLSNPCKAICIGFNDLNTTHPQLAKEWHPIKNGNLKPTDVVSGSNKKVWWLLPYDDPKTGKHFDFEWEATIASRVSGVGCPYISGKTVWYGYNDLETYCIDNQFDYILNQWDFKKNGNIKPSSITIGSSKNIWWIDINGKSYQKPVYKVVAQIKNHR